MRAARACALAAIAAAVSAAAPAGASRAAPPVMPAAVPRDSRPAAPPVLPAAVPLVSRPAAPPVMPAAAPRDSRPGATRASPGPPTRDAAWIARLVAATPAWPAPHADGSPRMLAPLGAATGGPVGLLVLEARGHWLRVLLPTRPNGASAWINARRVRLSRTRWRIAIDRSDRTVRVFHAGKLVRRLKAVVGAPATPTPIGRFAIAEIARQPDPHGFLGPFALHLTAHSTVLDDYGGGPGRVAIHGRGGESLGDPLGSARSHGCLRIDNEDVRFLAAHMVSGVPVTVAS